MSNVTTIDPALYTIIVGGSIMTGWAPGTMVTASRANDTWKKTVGATGEVVRSRNRDKTGTLVLTLLQTSPSNDVLSALAQQDEATGTGVVPVLVRDLLGRTVINAAQAWVLKPAEVGLGDETANREWTIDCAELQMNIGGN